MSFKVGTFKAAVGAGVGGALAGGALGGMIGARCGRRIGKTRTQRMASAGVGAFLGAAVGAWGGKEVTWQAYQDASNRMQEISATGTKKFRRLGVNHPSDGSYFAYSEGELFSLPEDSKAKATTQFLHYFESGEHNRDKGTLLLVHDFGNNAYQWTRVYDELARSYHVIAVDLPGCGYSTPLSDHNYNFQSRLSPVLAELLREKNISQATVVGSSMGGGVSLALASVEPDLVSRVVVFGSLSSTGEVHPIPWFIQAASYNVNLNLPGLYSLAAFLEREETLLTLTANVHTTLGTVNEHDVWQFSAPYVYDPRDPHRAFANVEARSDYARLVGDLISNSEAQKAQMQMQRAVKQPTLVVQSEADAVIPQDVAHALDRTVPHSELVLLKEEDFPRAGHALMSDSPRDTLNILRDFLSGKIKTNKASPDGDNTYLVYKGKGDYVVEFR